MSGHRLGGFTVIELLAVIAIIGLLAAILFPTLSAARVSANKARTRVQFNQWAIAVTAFRSEYGYYPSIDPSNKVNGGVDAVDHPFHDVLAGRKRDGSALAPTSAAALQNRKLIQFCSFAESDVTDPSSSNPNLLCDAFGNTDIVMLADRNLDGVINSGDFGPDLPLASGTRPDLNDFPVAGIRAGVVFYCAAPRGTAEAPQFIFSWK
ncbi:MAG: type II secretion system protein [Opitutus sp.]